VQLAAWMDFGEKFATVTRELQGEGVEVIMGTYEKMEALRRYCLSPTFPSAQAILNTAGMAYDYRFHYQKAVFYFQQEIPDLGFYRAARLLDPRSACLLEVLDVDLAILGNVEELREELPQYLAAAQGANEGVMLQWWRINGEKIPKWKAAARRVFAVSPTSAAAERVFSHLNSYVGDRQGHLLDDKIELMLMLQCRHHLTE